jgi:hypothetical protein
VAADDEHMWRLVEVALGQDATYECELCPEVLVVPAGDTPPSTC